MALVAINVKLNQGVGDGRFSTDSKMVTDLSATVAANVATLVADGATPTQGHVTTLNTNWTAFVGTYGVDASLILDTSKFTKLNQLEAAVKHLLQQARSSGMFTA